MAAKIWIPDILDSVARFLSPNEVACTLRLVNRVAAAHFRDTARIVRLSLPVPQHAFQHQWSSVDAFRPYTLRQRHSFLRLVAASGCIPNLTTALALAGCVLTARDEAQLHSSSPVAELLAAAAAAGHLDVVIWLRRRGCPWGTALVAAAGAGHLDICKWLMFFGCPRKQDALTAAARSGHHDVCDYLLDYAGWQWDEAAVCAAADGGHVDLMQALLQHPRRPAGLTDEHVNWHALAAAAARGCGLATLQHLHAVWTATVSALNDAAEATARDRALALRDVFAAAVESRTADWRAKVEWLRDLGCRCDAVVFSRGAAALPDDAVHRLQWLRQAGCPLDAYALRRAAAAGNTPAVRFLADLGVAPPCGAFEDAAEAGHLRVLQLLFSCVDGLDGAEFDATATAALRAAARGGHLPVVEWLVDSLGLDVAAPHVSPVEPDSLMGCTFAAGGERGAALRDWLALRGCGWEVPDLRVAAYHGNVGALEWLAEQGCEFTEHLAGSALLEGAMCHAAANGDLATLRCLRRLCFPWKPSPDTFTTCLAHGAPLEALQWMFAAGCPLVLQDAVSELEESRVSRVYSQEVLAWLDDVQRLHLPGYEPEVVAVPMGGFRDEGGELGAWRRWRGLQRWRRRRWSPAVTLVAVAEVQKRAGEASGGGGPRGGGRAAGSALRLAVKGLWGMVASAALPSCVFGGRASRGRVRGEALEAAEGRP